MIESDYRYRDQYRRDQRDFWLPGRDPLRGFHSIPLVRRLPAQRLGPSFMPCTGAKQPSEQLFTFIGGTYTHYELQYTRTAIQERNSSRRNTSHFHPRQICSLHPLPPPGCVCDGSILGRIGAARAAAHGWHQGRRSPRRCTRVESTSPGPEARR